jgi:hypothetical protein
MSSGVSPTTRQLRACRPLPWMSAARSIARFVSSVRFSESEPKPPNAK